MSLPLALFSFGYFGNRVFLPTLLEHGPPSLHFPLYLGNRCEPLTPAYFFSHRNSGECVVLTHCGLNLHFPSG